MIWGEADVIRTEINCIINVVCLNHPKTITVPQSMEKLPKKLGTASLHDTEAFIRKWKPKETVKPEHIYTKFDEVLKVMGKCNRIQAYKVMVVNWGKLSKACLFRFPSSKIRMVLSTRYREDTSHMRVLWPASGNKGKVRETPYLRILQFHQPKIFHMSRCHILG